MTLKEKISKILFEPKSILSLVVIRVSFGAIMLWEIARYFERGWIAKYWMHPDFNFPFEWFEWVKPWAGEGMRIHFYLLAVLSVLIILGLFYRVASILMFFSFSYVFLLEQARYLNHFYLLVLVSFLMMFMPAHKNHSLDALLWKSIKSEWIPGWAILLLQFQLGAAYFLGGIAKMNYDWLMLAEPMKHWLLEVMDFPFIGPLFDKPLMAYSMSWSGMFLDLLAPFLLVFRRTRPLMFAAILTFHFMNDRLFLIGIFPWFMIVASTIFFPADWPKRLVQTVRNHDRNQDLFIFAGALIFSMVGLFFHRTFEIIPCLVAGFGGAFLNWSLIDSYASPPAFPKAKSPAIPSLSYNPFVTGFCCLWILVQTAVPLRHYLIPGNVSWTEEGHRYSWQMKLRYKSARIKFFAYDPETKKRFEIDPLKYIQSWQFKEMSTKPHMILQFAKYLDEKLRQEGKSNHEVRVEAYARLNYRHYQLLIAPEVDLSKQSYSEFRHNSWVLQLNENLHREPVSDKDEE